MRFIYLSVLFIAFLGIQASNAQTVSIDDGFDDGNFTINPSWTDPEGKHIVNEAGRLQLNAPEVTDEAIITTSSTAAYGTWEAYIELGFNPSGSNRAKFYVLSDNQDLKGSLNGYFVMIGDTPEEISLYRKDGNTETRIIDGTDGFIDSNPVTVRVQLTRDLGGNWELLADAAGGSTFTSQGTVTDNTYASSSFIGFFSDYTSTRHDLFQYDDIRITKINPPLAIQDVTVQDNATIDVAFNLDIDPGSVQPNDFLLNNDGGSPATISSPTPNVIRLSYSANLPTNRYTLTVNDITDADGNIITPNATETFIIFGDFAAGDVVINEFLKDPPGAPGPSTEYIELKNTSSKYLNLQNWEIGEGTGNVPITSMRYVLPPNGFVAISPDTTDLFDVFGNRDYIQAGFGALNNGDDVINVVTATGTEADFLAYTADWGGVDVALERRSEAASSLFKENFGNSPDELGGTPSAANEVAQDNSPPAVENLIITADSLTLIYSERVASIAAENIANYRLNGGSNIATAQFSAPNSVRLSLSSPLQNGVTYDFSVQNQQDIFGNSTAFDTTLTFYVPTPVDSGKVFINEFLYDPSEGSEYVELYNPTDESFDLNGWTINDAAGNPEPITDSRFILPPRSYMVLAPDASLLQAYPDILLLNAASNFPSLNNSGDDIVLRDSSGTRIDSLSYTNTWGGDGLALERRSVQAPPIQPNFGDAPNGRGTPGAMNNIEADTTPPTLLQFTILSAQQLQFEFNEPLNASTVAAQNFTITGPPTAQTATLANESLVTIYLSEPLQNNTLYTVTISGLRDVLNNAIANRDTTFTYFEPSPADSGDVFINEFTYAPGQGSTEYVELYNASQKSLDLAGWTINDNTGNRRTITAGQYILPPESYLVLAPDETLRGNFTDINLVAIGSRFPSLNNSGDAIVLRDSLGTRLDSLTYTSAWGGDEVALERRTVAVAPIQANFGDAPNGFGTPGNPNQIPEDTTPPAITAFSIQNNRQLLLSFSEVIASASSTTISNYQLSSDLQISAATRLDDQTVRLQLNNALQNNTDYTFAAENIRDLFGNTLVPFDTTFTYFEPSPVNSGDVFINEFTYAPGDGSTEYVELYNASQKSLDLAGWTINDNTGNRRTITAGQYILPPESYLVLAPDETLRGNFADINLVAMGSRFPSLNNSGDAIVLRDSLGTRLDSLTYTSGWGGDEVALERRTVAVGPIQANFGDAPNGFGTPGQRNLIPQDNTPPDLANITIINNQSLRLDFSEALNQNPATNTANFTLNNSTTVANAELVTNTYVRLSLSSPLADGIQYQLAVTNQQDVFGNTAGTLTETLTFFEPVAADSGDIFINEFTFDPPEGSAEYIELYNPTDQSFDLNGWTVNDNTGNRQTITNTQFIIPADSFLVIAPDQTLLESYPDIALIDMGTRFPSLNNSGDNIVLRDSTGQRLDSLRYTNDWGGSQVALERRTVNGPPVQANFGDALNGFGTPGNSNQISEDTTPPVIAGFSIIDSQSLQIAFNETVDEQSAGGAANYDFSGPLTVSTAMLRDDQTVQISLSGAMQNNTDYTFTINRIEDIFGNALTNRDTTFTYFEVSLADSGDVFINEFMYNPASGQAEYIELYNPTSRSLNLQNWTINDNTGNRQTISSEQFIIPPDSFVVITPDHTLRQSYPDVALVIMGSRFPSLNNSGDDIVLRDQNGSLLDSLRYASAWGGNEVSLERRTVAVAPVQANFGDAPNGVGTPGSANDILPDTDPPRFNRLRIVSERRMQLIFSEPLRPATARTQGNYRITPNPGIQLLAAMKDTVNLLLSNDLQADQEYTVTVRNLQDVFGNTVAETSRREPFISFTDPENGSLVINEFLYNRAGVGAPEFVELYNPTDQNFDLSGWRLGDSTDDAVLPNGTRLTGKGYLLLTDNQALATTVGDAALVLPNFPSLNDDDDVIYLRSSTGLTVDSLRYDARFGGTEDGISAERIDPLGASSDPANFTASIAPAGSTPAAENSVFAIDKTPPTTIFSRIFPNGDVEVRFSEFIRLTDGTDFSIDGTSLEIAQFNPNQANRIFLRTNFGTPASQKAPSGAQTNTASALTVTARNLTDRRGNSTSTAQQPVARRLRPGDVVINEILYDPIADSEDDRPDQSEYIELRNIRDYAITLEGITLHDAPDEDGEVRTLQPVSTTNNFIPAGGTALIYADDTPAAFAGTGLSAYFELPEQPPQSLIKVDRSSLSLSSQNDAIYLTGVNGANIDSVFYSSSWQNPNLVDTDGVALERIRATGASNDASNWGSSTHPRGGTPNAQNSIFQQSEQSIGADNGISFSPNPFSPDGDGTDDRLFINYKLDQADYLLTVQIYDRYGRKVRKLADSKPAGFEGTLTWDGLKDNGDRNRIGIYIIILKAFDSAGGGTKAFKKTVVLARRLN